MGRATEKEVGDLHGLMVGVFHKILTDGEQTVTKDGEIVHSIAKPATLGVIRQFLSDSGIVCVANEPPASLASKLPFALDANGENIVTFGR